MNNDVIAQRIADAVLMNAVGRIASTYGFVLVPSPASNDGESSSPSETDAPREPSSDTSPSSPETTQPPQSNP